MGNYFIKEAVSFGTARAALRLAKKMGINVNRTQGLSNFAYPGSLGQLIPKGGKLVPQQAMKNQGLSLGLADDAMDGRVLIPGRGDLQVNVGAPSKFMSESGFGPRNTLLHELGHAIDYAKGGKRSRRAMHRAQSIAKTQMEKERAAINKLIERQESRKGKIITAPGADAVTHLRTQANVMDELGGPSKVISKNVAMEQRANKQAIKLIKKLSKNPVDDVADYVRGAPEGFKTYNTQARELAYLGEINRAIKNYRPKFMAKRSPVYNQYLNQIQKTPDIYT